MEREEYMFIKELRKKNNGFSLVEIIVVIAIMAAMTAVLVPALLIHVEKSRMSKDELAMSEVVNAVRISMAQEKPYNEVLSYTSRGNVSCYIQTDDENDLRENKPSTVSEINNEDEIKHHPNYRFPDENKYYNGMKCYAAGNMQGVTLTFIPENGKYVIYNGEINKYIKPDSQYKDEIAKNRIADNVFYIESTPNYARAPILGTMSVKKNENSYLYGDIVKTVGQEIPISSKTYRHSAFTVFIQVDKGTNVYGQFNGLDLEPQDDEISGPLIPDKNAPDVNVPVNPDDGNKPNPNPGGSDQGGTINPPKPPVNPDHVHHYTKTVVEPTCLKKGYTKHTCECGKSFIDEYVKAYGHDWGEYAVIEPATELKTGTEARICARCKEVQTREIPKLEHTENGHILKDGLYFVGVTSPLMRNEDVYRKVEGVQVYNPNDLLPAIQDGDIYIDIKNGCEYRYNYEYIENQWVYKKMNGWGVKVVNLVGSGFVKIDMLTPDMNGKPLTSMAYAFTGTGRNAQNIPDIPSTVTNMNYAFANNNSINNLSNWVVPANIESMSGTFANSKVMQTPDYSKAKNLKDISYCFENCQLYNVSLPAYVENMEGTFKNVQFMNYSYNIVIPATVKNMNSTFENSSMQSGSITINGNLFADNMKNCFNKFKSIDGIKLNGNPNNLELRQQLAKGNKKINVQ